MRCLLTIVAFVLFAESAGLVQLLKWATMEETFVLSKLAEKEDSEEKKNEETEGKKIDKNFHHFHFTLDPSTSGSQTFYIKNTGRCSKGYGRTVYQPPKI